MLETQVESNRETGPWTIREIIAILDARDARETRKVLLNIHKVIIHSQERANVMQILQCFELCGWKMRRNLKPWLLEVSVSLAKESLCYSVVVS